MSTTILEAHRIDLASGGSLGIQATLCGRIVADAESEAPEGCRLQAAIDMTPDEADACAARLTRMAAAARAAQVARVQCSLFPEG